MRAQTAESRRALDRRRHGRIVRFRAFTLLEVLVVIAVMALLAAILLPSLSRARWQTRHVHCQTNLYGIGRAWQAYLVDSKGKFLKAVKAKDNSHINFGGKQGMLSSYKGPKPLNRYLGLPLQAQMSAENFKCPFDQGGPGIQPTCYDYCGSSYLMNHFLVGAPTLTDRLTDPCLDAMRKASPRIAKLDVSQVANPSRVLLLGDYGWYNAWEFQFGADQQMDWHRRSNSHNLAFVDGHVQFVTIRKGINTDAKYTVIPFGDLQQECVQCQQEIAGP